MSHYHAPFRLDTAKISSLLLAIVMAGTALGQDPVSEDGHHGSPPGSLGISEPVIGAAGEGRRSITQEDRPGFVPGETPKRVNRVDQRMACRAADLGDADVAASERQKLFDDLSESMLQLQAQSAVLRKIVQATRPSVVHVLADKKQTIDPADLPPEANFEGPTEAFVEEAGSGVIVELYGKPYVLTNRHVIKGAELDKIRISLANRRTLKPTRVWSDESTDVAVLEIADSNVLTARVGDSDELEIGDLVLAIGSPFGLNHSVTHGIISAKGRRDLFLGSEKVRIQDFLQTDAPINPGNSGGPLINVRGEVVGINTAIASNSGGNEGIGFSIPINISLQVAQQLVQHGRFAQVYLGVKLDEGFESVDALALGLPIPVGTRVSDVAEGSPAAQAKLRRGDVIVAFDGVNVESVSHLVKLVGLSLVGTEVPLKLFRDGHFETAVVKIEEKRDE